MSQLLIILDPYSSLSNIKIAGWFSRLSAQYNQYVGQFEKIYIISNDDEKISTLPNNIEHLPFRLSLFPFYSPLRVIAYLIFSGILNYRKVDFVEIDDSRSIIAAFIYKLFGTRVFLHYRWSASKCVLGEKRFLLAKILKVVETASFNLSDIIGVTTRTLGDEIRNDKSICKIYLLPNFVDEGHFRDNDCEKIPLQLVFVGRLHKEKNLFLLLNIMKDLPMFRLWVIGDGPLRDKLISFKEKNQIENTEFLGRIPNEDLPRYLNKAEAFILLSDVEGHPKALIEAMACGLPCIGTNVDGIRDIIIDNETGLLSEKDEFAIRAKIIELFSNRDNLKRMGQNARGFVIENYSMSSLIRKRIKLIKGELDEIAPLYSS